MPGKPNDSLQVRAAKLRYQAGMGGDPVTAEFYQRLAKVFAEYPDEVSEPALIILLNRRCSCSCDKEAGE